MVAGGGGAPGATTPPVRWSLVPHPARDARTPIEHGFLAPLQGAGARATLDRGCRSAPPPATVWQPFRLLLDVLSACLYSNSTKNSEEPFHFPGSLWRVHFSVSHSGFNERELPPASASPRPALWPRARTRGRASRAGSSSAQCADPTLLRGMDPTERGRAIPRRRRDG